MVGKMTYHRARGLLENAKMPVGFAFVLLVYSWQLLIKHAFNETFISVE